MSNEKEVVHHETLADHLNAARKNRSSGVEYTPKVAKTAKKTAKKAAAVNDGDNVQTD